MRPKAGDVGIDEIAMKRDFADLLGEDNDVFGH